MTGPRRLDEIATIIMGQAPPGESYNAEGRGWPLIAGAGDFHNGRAVAKKYTTDATKLSQAGDIVLSIRASIGDKVRADGTYCLGRGVAGIRASSDVDQQFLWHWLTSVRSELAGKGRGATFKQVNRTDIGELPIMLPPLEEQRRVAEVLDRADELRAKRAQTIALLEDLTYSVFLDIFGDPIENPYGHEIHRLIDWIDPDRPITYGILKPGADQHRGVKYIRVVDMKDESIDLSQLKQTTATIAHQYRRSLLKPGDRILSIRGNVWRLARIP